LVIGRSPPDTSPTARKSTIKARVASAMQIEADVRGRPFGPITASRARPLAYPAAILRRTNRSSAPSTGTRS
jgi:hypothetical protein